MPQLGPSTHVRPDAERTQGESISSSLVQPTCATGGVQPTAGEVTGHILLNKPVFLGYLRVVEVSPFMPRAILSQSPTDVQAHHQSPSASFRRLLQHGVRVPVQHVRLREIVRHRCLLSPARFHSISHRRRRKTWRKWRCARRPDRLSPSGTPWRPSAKLDRLIYRQSSTS